MFMHTLLCDHTRQQWVINFTPLNILSPARFHWAVYCKTWLFGMASYAVVLPSWKIFIILFYSGMCSAVWCVSHYVPHAIDHLLISLHAIGTYCHVYNIYIIHNKNWQLPIFIVDDPLTALCPVHATLFQDNWSLLPYLFPKPSSACNSRKTSKQ